MQNIENDMDDLFRKAVDQVPLLPVKSRWNEIARKLSPNSSFSSLKEKKTNIKRIITILSYFLLGILASTTLTTFIKYNRLNKPDNQLNSINILPNGKPLYSKKGVPGTILSFIKSSHEKKTSSNISPEKARIKGTYSDLLFVDSTNKSFNSKPDLNIDDPERSSKRMNADIKGIYFNCPAPSITSLNPVAYIGLLQKHSPVELNDNLNNPANLPLKSLNSSYIPHFYLGLAGGILMSQIKTQGFTKPGYDIGLLVGYKFNKKLSIETGLLFSKQYYFASGKYYNSITRAGTAKSLEGSRTVYEIPLKLQYYVFHNKTGSFFISGGVSSYVGVNDKILINVGENTPNPTQKYNYGTANYLPSYLDFSLGYGYQFGRLVNLRVEPFVEIPLSSTVGNTINIYLGSEMQVLNAGLHLVITEFIH